MVRYLTVYLLVGFRYELYGLLLRGLSCLLVILCCFCNVCSRVRAVLWCTVTHITLSAISLYVAVVLTLFALCVCRCFSQCACCMCEGRGCCCCTPLYTVVHCCVLILVLY